MRYLLLDADDIVRNAIELDDAEGYTPAAGLRLVADDGTPAHIGLTLGESLPVAQQSARDLIVQAMSQRERLEPMTVRMQREAFLYNIAAHGRALLEWLDPANTLPVLPADSANDTTEQAKWRALNVGETRAIEQERWMREQRAAYDALPE